MSCNRPHLDEGADIGFKAYYLPNQDRPNLYILVNANVNKIHSNDKSPGDFVATGVEFSFENSIYVAHATKEVIVSSGYVSWSLPSHGSDASLDP